MSAASWLQGEVVPLAYCWRLLRSDGLALGLTTHDRMLKIGRDWYRPAPGIRPSAIHQRLGLEGDMVEVAGALSSAAIDARDLALGRWDGAVISLLAVNWQRPDDAPVAILRGRLGEVATQGVEFSADISGRDPRLDMPLLPETSSGCRAELGDGRCRVAMAGRRHRAVMRAVSGRRITLDRTFPQDHLAFGQLRWLSGAPRGCSVAIAGNQGAELELTEAAAVPVGTAVEVTEGCDKSAACCRLRFDNLVNFRGEPHVPGLDLLTRYPGG